MAPMSRLRLSIALLLAVAGSAVLPVAPASATDDVTPPSILALSPTPGSVVGTGKAVELVFDEPVVNVSRETLVLRSEGADVGARLSWDPESLTARLTPINGLTIATDYAVVVRSGITDLAGNPLPEKRWEFRTNRRIAFAPGTYTGYRFASDDRTFTAIRRVTFEEMRQARADRHRRLNGQGYAWVTRGQLDGFWVHARRRGEMLDDRAAPITPRPSCAYDDFRTVRTSFRTWASTVLDTLFRLPRGYAPGDLVDTSRAGLNGGHRIRAVALDDLAAMVAAAKRDGAWLAVQSAYRSYDSQVASFDYWVRRIGRAEALKVSARPGHSEHQLGTTIDFRSWGGPAPWDVNWAATREGTWMARHAWKYGWVMSYPDGTSRTSCYSFEPWHYRYVGRESAAAVREDGRAPRAWLWSRGFGVR